MKTAMTVWDGWISPVFDVCREALVVEIEGGKVVSRTKVDLHAASPIGKIERLHSHGVETLICGAVSEPVERELTSYGLKVIAFVAGEIDAVLEAFVAGQLPTPALSMPGCRGGQRRRNGGRGKGHGRGRRRGHRGRYESKDS